MATETKRSKGRFLYLFDWNGKSRKKLFSNKSETSEGSHQGKESVDNLVISQYLLRELRENGDHFSFRGSDNYSCASSVNGDDGYGTKAPGVVARLMGLDSMPTTSCEASSISSYESRAVSSSYYPRDAASFQHEHHALDYSYAPQKVEGFPWRSMDSRTTKVHGRPIERFQTEVLPPKSAKPISITHHKLLSPIKSPGFVPTKDAAYVMEAAARMIDSSPQPSGRVKIKSLGSPSSSFRLQDLKEKMDAAQRSSTIPETSNTPKHSASVQQMRGSSSDRSTNRSLFKNIMGSETSSLQKVKNKGKSISVPVRDKNVQRKEGSANSDNRSQQQKEPKQVKLKQKQPSTQKAGQIKTSRSKTSGVLRQNNDKQNSVSNKDKSTSKSSVSDQKPRKFGPVDNSAGPSKIINKVFVTTENVSKKVMTDKRATVDGVGDKRPLLNKMKNISRGKQGVVRRDNRLAENVPDNGGERAEQCDQSHERNSRKDMDVISFTFTSPIKKSSTQSSSSMEATGSNRRYLGADSYDTNDQSYARSSSSPPLGLNLIDSGSLSLLLEQKLKELTDKIVSNKSDMVMDGPDVDSMSCLSESISSHDIGGTPFMEYDELSHKDQTGTTCDDDCSSSMISKSSQKWEDFEGIDDHGDSDSNKCEASRESNLGYLNVSISECSISGSCMSSNTASDFTCGYDQPTSPQSQEVMSSISAESVHPRGEDSDITGVASYWELEYVRYVLHYAGLKRFRLEMDCMLIDPSIFDLLENLINISGRNAELCSKHERKMLFDCIAEIVSSRYERVYLGSQKSWAKWRMLLQQDCLTEDVYKEIFCLQSMGNLMVDELVDREMSTQYGRWLDFEIESLEEGMGIEEEIVTSLVDELVADLFI